MPFLLGKVVFFFVSIFLLRKCCLILFMDYETACAMFCMFFEIRYGVSLMTNKFNSINSDSFRWNALLLITDMFLKDRVEKIMTRMNF